MSTLPKKRRLVVKSDPDIAAAVALHSIATDPMNVISSTSSSTPEINVELTTDNISCLDPLHPYSPSCIREKLPSPSNLAEHSALYGSSAIPLQSILSPSFPHVFSADTESQEFILVFEPSGSNIEEMKAKFAQTHLHATIFLVQSLNQVERLCSTIDPTPSKSMFSLSIKYASPCNFTTRIALETAFGVLPTFEDTPVSIFAVQFWTGAPLETRSKCLLFSIGTNYGETILCGDTLMKLRTKGRNQEESEERLFKSMEWNLGFAPARTESTRRRPYWCIDSFERAKLFLRTVDPVLYTCMIHPMDGWNTHKVYELLMKTRTDDFSKPLDVVDKSMVGTFMITLASPQYSTSHLGMPVIMVAWIDSTLDSIIFKFITIEPAHHVYRVQNTHYMYEGKPDKVRMYPGNPAPPQVSSRLGPLIASWEQLKYIIVRSTYGTNEVLHKNKFLLDL